MDRVTSQGRLLAFDRSSTSKVLHFTVRSEKLSTLEVEDHCKWQTLCLWFSDRPTLTFKIFLFDKVVVTSEMRLGKLRYSNTVKADRRPFFGSEDLSRQWERLRARAHCVTARCRPVRGHRCGPHPDGPRRSSIPARASVERLLCFRHL